MIKPGPILSCVSHTATARGTLLIALTLVLASSTLNAQGDQAQKFAQAERLSSEAVKLRREGQLRSALDNFERALRLYEDIAFFERQGEVLTYMGQLQESLGERQKALESLRKSLRLLDPDNRRLRLEALSALGIVCFHLGYTQESVESLEQGVKLAQEMKDWQSEGKMMLSLGAIDLELGRADKASKRYLSALKIFKEHNDQNDQGVALLGLGRVVEEMDPAQALAFYDRAVVDFASSDRRLQAYAFNNLGEIHGRLNQHSEALQNYQKALAIFRELTDLPGQALILGNIGRVHNNLHDTQKSVAALQEALKLSRAVGDRRGVAAALYSLAVSDEAQGGLSEASRKIDEAISIIESLRTGITSPDLRSAYFGTVQRYYRYNIALLMRLHKLHPDAGFDAQAFHVNESARARALLDTLAEAHADIRQGVDDRLLEQKRRLEEQLNARGWQQFEARSTSSTESKSLAGEIDALTEQLHHVETKIRLGSPHYAALTQPRPLSVKEIQSSVLDRETLLLEYSLGTDRSYLWAVTPDSITSYELPNYAEIHQSVYVLEQLLNERNKRVDETEAQRQARVKQADVAIPAAAASLSRKVLAPVAGQLGKKRLLIVGDGGLLFIPFAVLPAPVTTSLNGSQGSRTTNTNTAYTNAKPLIVDHEIVNIDSASTLAIIRREMAGRRLAPKAVVALADPVFEADDVRVTSRDAGNKNSRAARLKEDARTLELVEAAEGFGGSSQKRDVPRLPATRKEAEEIVAMVPTAADRMLALDFAASRETATGAKVGQYRYVHFSTHGFLNTEKPELSGLVFSLVDQNGNPQDGFLRAHEVFNLKLPAELVVLSACQTGIGREVKGEGLVSLTRGFMYAGAPRVVVSLWSVSEWGTTELMVRFYRGILKGGLRPAAALRAAQISLMKEDRWSSPFYWAPFILQGEWQ